MSLVLNEDGGWEAWQLLEKILIIAHFFQFDLPAEVLFSVRLNICQITLKQGIILGVLNDISMSMDSKGT